MLNFRATFAHIKTQIGTKIKIWLATMLDEAVVYLSSRTDSCAHNKRYAHGSAHLNNQLIGTKKCPLDLLQSKAFQGTAKGSFGISIGLLWISIAIRTSTAMNFHEQHTYIFPPWYPLFFTDDDIRCMDIHEIAKDIRKLMNIHINRFFDEGYHHQK